MELFWALGLSEFIVILSSVLGWHQRVGALQAGVTGISFFGIVQRTAQLLLVIPDKEFCVLQSSIAQLNQPLSPSEKQEVYALAKHLWKHTNFQLYQKWSLTPFPLLMNAL